MAKGHTGVCKHFPCEAWPAHNTLTATTGLTSTYIYYTVMYTHIMHMMKQPLLVVHTPLWLYITLLLQTWLHEGIYSKSHTVPKLLMGYSYSALAFSLYNTHSLLWEPQGRSMTHAHGKIALHNQLSLLHRSLNPLRILFLECICEVREHYF